jgi:hypothetical protein
MMIVVTAISMMSMTAFAAEEDVLDENFYGVEIPTEEESNSDETLTPSEETNESVEAGETVTEDTLTDITDENAEKEDGTDNKDEAFSVDGNGEVLDNVIDEKSGKEFYTIVTANNNTYYLIIDHASSSKNVYMLSMIDENDLKEFLSEEEPVVPEDTGKTPTVDFGEDTKDEEPSDDDKQEEPKKDNNIMGTVLIILVLGAVAGGVYFYFKIYKPKKEAQIADEDMEYVDDGVTVNEDDVSENEDVNSDTYVDELTFDDEEAEAYEE